MGAWHRSAAASPNIQVPPGNTPYLLGHAVGTQNYICLPSDNEFAFKLFTPEATLFTNAEKQITTHYFSPNPVEGGTTRATWQHRDTSTVWGKVVPGDSAKVNSDGIEWLKVTVVGTKEGPSGGDALAHDFYSAGEHCWGTGAVTGLQLNGRCRHFGLRTLQSGLHLLHGPLKETAREPAKCSVGSLIEPYHDIDREGTPRMVPMDVHGRPQLSTHVVRRDVGFCS